MSNCEMILKKMLRDVQDHQRDKNSLLQMYVEKRLDASLMLYYRQLVENMDALSKYNEEKVLKKLIKNK